MSEYRAIYKCRLCGEEFVDGRTGKTISYMSVNGLVLQESFKLKNCGIRVRRHNIHNCLDGSFGFADFIGFRKVEDKK